MVQYAESIYRDEFLPDEIKQYRPVSPAATLGLVFGLFAVVAAIMVGDIGLWAFLPVPVFGLFFAFRGARSVKRYDMAGKGAARLGTIFSALALVGGIAGHAYIVATSIPPGYEPITYEPLQGMGIPASAQALDGKRIFIQGYVYPTSQSKGIKSFLLCRDNGTCCFGGKPKENDMIEVKLKDPLTLNYTSSLHGVGGTLRVKAEKAPGDLGTVLYHIEDADFLQ